MSTNANIFGDWRIVAQSVFGKVRKIPVTKWRFGEEWADLAFLCGWIPAFAGMTCGESGLSRLEIEKKSVPEGICTCADAQVPAVRNLTFLYGKISPQKNK